MASAKTITINGRTYDAVTGMLLDTPREESKATTKEPARSANKPRESAAAGAMHSTAQRSKTLHRRAAKKPATAAKPSVARPTAGARHMDIARSAHVSHFAAHPVTKPAPTSSKAAHPVPAKPAARPTTVKPVTAKTVVARPAAHKAATVDKAPQAHPTAQRALSKVHAKKQQAVPAAPLSAKQKKDGEIAKAIAAPTHKPKKLSKRKLTARNRKYLIILFIVLAFVILAITAYKVFPGISVGIAASRAGISATYPEYTPDGFALSQPVTFKEGEVSLTFKSNGSNRAYTITQQRSSWDSSSVLDNIVQPAAGNNYVTTKERGLTIFTYGNNASWMNGGLLYTISGDTQLSGDQVRRIATSL